MKLIAVIALVLTIFTVQASAARWCYVSNDGGRNCGFTSKKQCDAARKGNTVDNCTRSK